MTLDPVAVALVAIGGMLCLILLGVPIALSMGLTGTLGLLAVAGPSAAMAQLALIPWEQGRSFIFVTIPLFILMGQLVLHCGLANDAYDSVRAWLGRIPGGMAVAAVAACTAFGAVTGSSVATVATMGAISMPAMRRYGYDVRLATGTLAASGTLGILIPPSVVFVVYGVMTETSIGKLFVAGIIPGILTAVIYVVIIVGRCLANPALGPRGPAASWRERLLALPRLLPLLAIFAVVIGGLYAGIFTPTEGAGMGCAAVILVGASRRGLSWRGIHAALEETALTSSMIFAIIIGGYLLSRFIALTGLPSAAVGSIAGLGLNGTGLILVLFGLFLMLGCVLDVFGMLVLTIPFVLPLVKAAELDLIWFGVFVVVASQVALITPPVGANVFVMRKVAPDVPTREIFAGTLPFLVGELVLIGILIAFPEVATWLPSRMN